MRPITKISLVKSSLTPTMLAFQQRS